MVERFRWSAGPLGGHGIPGNLDCRDWRNPRRFTASRDVIGLARAGVSDISAADCRWLSHHESRSVRGFGVLRVPVEC